MNVATNGIILFNLYIVKGVKKHGKRFSKQTQHYQ